MGVEVEGVGEEGGGGVWLTVEVEEMVADQGGVRGKAIALLQFVGGGGAEKVEGEIGGGKFGWGGDKEVYEIDCIRAAARIPC